MKKKKGKVHPSKYLNDLAEWNEHQYDPGHWTGANFPPHIKYGGRRLGLVLITAGLLTLAVIIIDLIIDPRFAMSTVIGSCFAILLLASGIKLNLFTGNSHE